MRRWATVVASTVLVAAAVMATNVATGRSDAPASDADEQAAVATQVTSSAPRFVDESQMAAAADLVVVATVASVADGRTITAPDDPTSGIRTRLATLVVEQVLAGDPPTPLVLEQEATLLDGTPVVVDGVDPVGVGDTGTWYLLAGGSDEFPYHALVGAPGWVPGEGG